MQIETKSLEMNRVAATNFTTAGTSIANPACSKNGPSGDGIIMMGSPDGAMTSNGLLILPYGVGSATTFLLSVFGWDFVHPKVAQNAGMWVAWLMAAFNCTLGATTGLAGGEVDNTNNFCDTIVETTGNPNVSNEVISPTGGLIASILLDAKGAKRIQLAFAMNGSSTSANALQRRL